MFYVMFFANKVVNLCWRHDTCPNDIHYNGIQRNKAQQNDIQHTKNCDIIKHLLLMSVISTECRNSVHCT
jgi:hypothetical protein